ncbi:hypothetical protein M1O20_03845 [Dehalococcoidia bacterium]|nr:hypothetical protein [Dehalococcoidia bacterium]
MNLEKMDRMEFLASRSPWNLPLSEDWGIEEGHVENKTLKSGERLLLVDKSLRGWFKGLAMVATSPKVKASIKLQIPGNVSVDYDTTAEKLNAFNIIRPTGSFAPFITLYDTTTNRYAFYVQPVFPGISFNGRAMATLTNEDTVSATVIFAEYSIWTIK